MSSPDGGYRAQAKLIVSLFPGIHIRRLQKLLGASFSTTRHHVRGLEQSGEIVRAKDGRYDRLYLVGVAENMRVVHAVLQSKTARTILKTLAESDLPPLTNGELASRTRLPRSTISESLAELGRVSLTKRTLEADGRIRFSVLDKQGALVLLSQFREGVLNVAAERFIDLWEL